MTIYDITITFCHLSLWQYQDYLTGTGSIYLENQPYILYGNTWRRKHSYTILVKKSDLFILKIQFLFFFLNFVLFLTQKYFSSSGNFSDCIDLPLWPRSVFASCLGVEKEILNLKRANINKYKHILNFCSHRKTKFSLFTDKIFLGFGSYPKAKKWNHVWLFGIINIWTLLKITTAFLKVCARLTPPQQKTANILRSEWSVFFKWFVFSSYLNI